MSNAEHAAILQQKIAQRIARAGSIDTAEFMAMTMGDKQHGYYANAEPFGQKGDFITAPEISQLFGEIIALWVIAAWQALGCPAAFVLCEAGPGRGTLSDDMLRSLAKAAPACARAANMVLMETSPALRRRQQEKLAKHDRPLTWVEDCAALGTYIKGRLSQAPLIFIANELLDVLPVRQYQKSAQGWHERRIKADKTGRLHFVPGRPQILPLLPPDTAFARACRAAKPGAIIEISPARQAFVQALSRLLAANRGAALLIDYGSLEHGFGDTLQAVAKHRFAAVFENIGTSDLSSHVDFAALMAAAQAENCRAAAMPQGEFLLQMGLLERAGWLGADKDEACRRQIIADVERLAAPDQMGELFKILCIADLDTIMPPFAP
ncbi:class I SAM-dependent methyltransferase [Candidatus Tokpelaia sp.]|uniref:class I SAM-dependent methyltransferase n=1 Tax=Candidatus Tokpelaia sp. TaxID=2233777 RepID=UPI001239D891|nr:SAM-dependent methyltransferase [Candidatus Tokpelaia sp.]KAA6405727.1 class I SAM-dependent methyltransferase [Candidatus Tokpelaia sp.]